MKQDHACWQLFSSFFRIGAFTFGGGYAMIPLIQREAGEKRKWITDDDLLEILAISESTPGPSAINSATFIGYRVAGIPGSAAATFGVVLPSFAIILLISMLLQQFATIPAVQYALFGIRAGVCAMLIKSFLSMYKKCKKNWFAYAVMGLAALLSFFLDLSVIWIVIGAGISGILLCLVNGRRQEE